MLENKKFLNSNAIKLIAIIAMTIDHIAWAVYPGYSTEPGAIVMHIIGRITCPIMCYCIAEGFHYTHDVKKYTLRLLILHLSHMFLICCNHRRFSSSARLRSFRLPRAAALWDIFSIKQASCGRLQSGLSCSV